MGLPAWNFNYRSLSYLSLRLVGKRQTKVIGMRQKILIGYFINLCCKEDFFCFIFVISDYFLLLLVKTNGGEGQQWQWQWWWWRWQIKHFFFSVCVCVFPRLESKQEEERNSGGRFECGCQGQSVTTTAGVS